MGFHGDGRSAEWYKANIKGFLLDVYGVLYDSGSSDIAISGSIEGVRKLREAGVPFRFCSNTSTRSASEIVHKLEALGFDVRDHEVFTPIPAAISFLRKHNLRPFLIVDPAVDHEFAAFDKSNPNCVVLGDAQDRFSYANMNQAFQILLNNRSATLVTLGSGKYYKEVDGLKLDCGTYAHALEFACDVKATIIGKPSADFFNAALEDMKLKPVEAVMVGDDIIGDVQGAQSCGLHGVQVRTGKYRPDDEPHAFVKPDGYVDNLLQAVNLFLQNWN